MRKFFIALVRKSQSSTNTNYHAFVKDDERKIILQKTDIRYQLDLVTGNIRVHFKFFAGWWGHQTGVAAVGSVLTAHNIKLFYKKPTWLMYEKRNDTNRNQHHPANSFFIMLNKRGGQ